MQSGSENPRGSVSSGNTPKPYISIVATARNDNHGGNLLGRMQVFVEAWIRQAKRHNLASELILVEWNPPAGKPRLAEALRWPEDTGPCQVRIIEVSAELHRRYRHAEALPLYQMIGKNVGIRRARGEFVLATNIDIVFSDELVAFLAARKLRNGRLYRIDRTDVAGEIPVDGSLDQQLAYCRGHIIRLCARHGIFQLTPEGFRENLPNDIVKPGAGTYFGEGWYEIERYMIEHFRWMDEEAEVSIRVPKRGGILALEIEPGPGVRTPPQPLQLLDQTGKLIAEWEIAGRTLIHLHVPAALGKTRQSIRFRAPSGGYPVPGDPRVMNFRFFRCDWMNPKSPKDGRRPFWETADKAKPLLKRMIASGLRGRPVSFALTAPLKLWRAIGLLRMRGRDIFHDAFHDAGADFRVGDGWYPVEHDRTGIFRWAPHQAEIVLAIREGSTNLEFLVEPGPSIGFRPFNLVVRLQDGRIVKKQRVNGLTHFRVALPIQRGKQTSVFLVPERLDETPACEVPGDARTLTYRVLACGRGPQSAKPPAPEPTVAGGWPSLTIDSRPPDCDWDVMLQDQRKAIADMGKPKFLHLYACGDFQMMAREDWDDVRAYAELDEFSMHLDSIFSYAAYHNGIEEEVLPPPMRIYHIEHGIGSGWTPEGHNALMERINKLKISSISFPDLAEMVAQMRQLHAPLIFNLDNWGMADIELPETSPAGAEVAQVTR